MTAAFASDLRLPPWLSWHGLLIWLLGCTAGARRRLLHRRVCRAPRGTAAAELLAARRGVRSPWLVGHRGELPRLARDGGDGDERPRPLLDVRLGDRLPHRGDALSHERVAHRPAHCPDGAGVLPPRNPRARIPTGRRASGVPRVDPRRRERDDPGARVHGHRRVPGGAGLPPRPRRLACALARQLPARRAPGSRGHGRSVEGKAPPARAAGRGEDHRRARGVRQPGVLGSHHAATLRARGAGHRRAHVAAHRLDLRLRHQRGRRLLLRDGAARGNGSAHARGEDGAGAVRTRDPFPAPSLRLGAVRTAPIHRRLRTFSRAGAAWNTTS